MCINYKLAYQPEPGSRLHWIRAVSELPLGQELLKIPCGKCVECNMQYSREWALRCALESRQYTDNCFITLTYNDENLVESVQKRELQLFLKRLRKHIAPLKIRYFACGEYGDIGGRPHYHLCLFGYVPDDVRYLYTRDGRPVYTSSIIESIWGRGYITVESFTYHTAMYTAKYMQKILPTNRESFVMMSQGLGRDSIDDSMLDVGCIYYNGYYYPVPRYFVRKLGEKQDVSTYVEERKRRAMQVDQCLTREQKNLKIEKSSRILRTAFSKIRYKKEKYYARSSNHIIDDNRCNFDKVDIEALKFALLKPPQETKINRYDIEFRKSRKYFGEKLLTELEVYDNVFSEDTNYSQNL